MPSPPGKILITAYFVLIWVALKKSLFSDAYFQVNIEVFILNLLGILFVISFRTFASEALIFFFLRIFSHFKMSLVFPQGNPSSTLSFFPPPPWLETALKKSQISSHDMCLLGGGGGGSKRSLFACKQWVLRPGLNKNKSGVSGWIQMRLELFFP